MQDSASEGLADKLEPVLTRLGRVGHRDMLPAPVDKGHDLWPPTACQFTNPARHLLERGDPLAEQAGHERTHPANHVAVLRLSSAHKSALHRRPPRHNPIAQGTSPSSYLRMLASAMPEAGYQPYLVETEPEGGPRDGRLANRLRRVPFTVTPAVQAPNQAT